jgi:hypothetical protein
VTIKDNIKMCYKQNGVKNKSRKIGNKSFEYATKFKYLGTTLIIIITCMKKLQAE